MSQQPNSSMYQLHEASYPTPTVASTLFSPIHRMGGPDQRLNSPAIMISADAISSAKSGGGPAFASAAMQPLAPASAAAWGDARTQYGKCLSQVCGPGVSANECAAQCWFGSSGQCDWSSMPNCMRPGYSEATAQQIRQGMGGQGGASAARAMAACNPGIISTGQSDGWFCGCVDGSGCKKPIQTVCMDQKYPYTITPCYNNACAAAGYCTNSCADALQQSYQSQFGPACSPATCQRCA